MFFIHESELFLNSSLKEQLDSPEPHVFSVTKGSEVELLSGDASGNTPKA